jgi:pyrimidine operon attenuation protein/uracil phosphoribosyltransferase
MSASEIDRTLVRLAHEDSREDQRPRPARLHRHPRRGVPLAQRLAKKIEALETARSRSASSISTCTATTSPPSISKPVVSATEIPFPVQGKDIILMDDVLYTGRTIRAALDALFDHGRPSRVRCWC